MKSQASLKYLQILVLVCIFGFSGINFLTDNSAKTTLSDIKSITKASQNYFNDIGYWPNFLKDLIDKNYLKGEFSGYSLLNQNGKLNLAITANDKNNADLQRYLIKYRTDEKLNKILVQIEEFKRVKAKINLGICSNLSCPLY